MQEQEIKTIKARIVNKHNTEKNWLEAGKAGFTPKQGELIVYDIEIDQDSNILELPEGRTEPYLYERTKIGDGITKVHELPFSTLEIKNGEGKGAIAQGYETRATGDYAFAEGLGTKALSKYQHVQGKYNIEDTSNEYAHIVGNGDADNRSNAYTLDWNGNAWFAGEIKIGESNKVILTGDKASNALKGRVQGNPVTFNDVDLSPLAHDALCKLVSKNIIPYPYRSSTTIIHGVTFTDNGDGTITAKGTSTGNLHYYLINEEIKVVEDLILSGCPTGGSAATYHLQAVCRTPEGNYVHPTDVGNGATIIKGYTITQLFIIIKLAAGTVDFVFKPQLERGEVVTHYTPYMEDFSNIEVTVTTGEGESTTYTTDENGRVTIPSVTKDTIISSIPDVVIEAEYNVDTNVVPRDYVKKTDYASKDNAGAMIVGEGLIAGDNGKVHIKQADMTDIANKKHGYNPITPKYLDYAVKSALSDCKIEWTDEEKTAAKELLGIKDPAGFVTMRSDENGKLIIPKGVYPNAQLLEVHGWHEEYAVYDTYMDCVPNYPVEIRTDSGKLVFRITDTDAVDSNLPDFGIQGNYIFFSDGRIYYKQTTRLTEYSDSGAEGEYLVDTISDTHHVYRLVEPIVKDITDIISFSTGATNIERAEYIIVTPRYTEDEVKSMVNVDSGSDPDNYTYVMPYFKIVFENQGG